MTSCDERILFDYIDVINYITNLEDFFKIDNCFIYIYSESCRHCEAIKQVVLKSRLEKNHPIYFIPYDNSIPIISDKDLMIGVDKYEDVGIVGVPSLFILEDKKITSYLVGGGDIVSYLENLRPIPS